jgi:ribosomal protein S24E
MDLIDFKEKENNLLSRKEFTATIGFENATPSRHDIVQYFGDKHKVNHELVVIKKVSTAFGSKKAVVQGCIYADEKARSVERAHNMWRSMTKEKRKETIDAKKAKKKAKKKEPAKQAKAKK